MIGLRLVKAAIVKKLKMPPSFLQAGNVHHAHIWQGLQKLNMLVADLITSDLEEAEELEQVFFEWVMTSINVMSGCDKDIEAKISQYIEMIYQMMLVELEAAEQFEACANIKNFYQLFTTKVFDEDDE